MSGGSRRRADGDEGCTLVDHDYGDPMGWTSDFDREATVTLLGKIGGGSTVLT
jgi:hypothetical protein